MIGPIGWDMRHHWLSLNLPDWMRRKFPRKIAVKPVGMTQEVLVKSKLLRDLRAVPRRNLKLAVAWMDIKRENLKTAEENLWRSS